MLTCPSCTNGITDPAPVAEYDDHQFFAHAEASLDQWRAYSRQIVDFLARQGRSEGRLLDVGSSHGLLLEEARARGWKTEGIEPSRTAVEHSRARGLTVTHGYLTEGALPEASFDVVVLSHVIEHVVDPAALLRAARSVLRPGGAICLCQTNYRGTVPQWFGSRWDYWVEHEHYYHFSPTGVEHLLRSADLELAAIELLPLGYKLDLSSPTVHSAPGAALRVLKFAVTRLRIGMPYVGDQMYVLAESTS